jgi:hypothetical protein
VGPLDYVEGLKGARVRSPCVGVVRIERARAEWPYIRVDGLMGT